MTRPATDSHDTARNTALMRAWLRRRMTRRAGGRLSNPFLRLSRAVGRVLTARRVRLCNPGRLSLTIRIQPGLHCLTALGLGLAGGGGGSPGDAVKVRYVPISPRHEAEPVQRMTRGPRHGHSS